VAFEESFRAATAAISIGSEEPTMAGVDARMQGLPEVVRIAAAARGAKRSVSLNLVAASGTTLLGLGLALSWHGPVVVLGAGALGFAAAALATLNGPYPLLEEIGERGRRGLDWIKRLLKLKRSPAR